MMLLSSAGVSGVETQFAQTANEIAPGIVDIANSIRLVGESLIDAVSRARLSVAMTDTQLQLLDLQLQRAQQGLPPVDVSGYLGGRPQIDNRTVMLGIALLVGLILLTNRSR